MAAHVPELISPMATGCYSGISFSRSLARLRLFARGAACILGQVRRSDELDPLCRESAQFRRPRQPPVSRSGAVVHSHSKPLRVIVGIEEIESLAPYFSPWICHPSLLLPRSSATQSPRRLPSLQRRLSYPRPWVAVALVLAAAAAQVFWWRRRR